MKAKVIADRVWIEIPYSLKDRAKRVPGGRWQAAGWWSWPATCAPALRAAFPGENIPDGGTKPLSTEPMRDNNGRTVMRAVVADPLSNFTPRVQSYAHQMNALAFVLARLFSFLAMEMGTGKTKVTVDAMSFMASVWGGAHKIALVFCPKTLMANWRNEIEQFGEGLRVVLVEGATKQAEVICPRACKVAHTEPGMTVFIVNYDKAWRMIEALVALNPAMIVLDESHKIKTWKAKRTKAIVNAFEHLQCRKVCLTGTPIAQSVLDLYPQYRFLSPEIMGEKNWYAYRATYCTMGGYQGYQIVSFKNLDRLRAKIAPVTFELKKDDTGIDFPDKQYLKRVLDMPDALRTQYDSMRKDLILLLEQDKTIAATIVLTKILRLQEITSGHYLPQPMSEDNGKVVELLDLLSGDLLDKKIIVWCNYRKTIEIVAAACEKAGRNVVTFHGDTDDRDGAVKSFQVGEKNAFIGQIQTGGVGLNLTAAAYTVYFENTFSLAERKQSEDRIHRIGQKAKTCTYIDLVYDNSVDLMIMKAIDKKSFNATDVIDSFKKGEYKI